MRKELTVEQTKLYHINKFGSIAEEIMSNSGSTALLNKITLVMWSMARSDFRATTDRLIEIKNMVEADDNEFFLSDASLYRINDAHDEFVAKYPEKRAA